MADTIVRDLPVPLSDEEMIRRAQEFGANDHEQLQLDAQLARVRKKINKRLKRLRAQAHKLAKEVRDGERILEVDCYIYQLVNQKLVAIVRLDNGKVVTVRDMTDDEQQMVLGEDQDQVGDIPGDTLRAIKNWMKSNKKGTEPDIEIVEVPEPSKDEISDDELAALHELIGGDDDDTEEEEED